MKFNPKEYRGKKRIYVAVKNATRISRLYVWDKSEYRIPPSGKTFVARRYENKKRVEKFFDTLDEARDWQQGIATSENPFAPEKKVNKTPLFSKVVEDWMKRGLVGTEESTLRLYERILDHHFKMMMDKHMDEITGDFIDKWLDELMDPEGARFNNANRTSFRPEINLLRSILLFYKDSARRNYQHTDWHYPLEKNQIKRAKKKIRASNRDRDIKLSVSEFELFLKEIGSHGKYKSIMPDFAIIQFYCSLRVSECAALYHEDIHLDLKNPHQSYLVIKRHIDWPRKKDAPSSIKKGFKNSKHLKTQTKTLMIYPEAFKVLAKIWNPKAKGLLFKADDTFFEYRVIEHAYNQAFKRAKLLYTGTHIMRHGGTTWVYNQSNGNAAIAQKQLGVVDAETVFTYVQADNDSLTNFAKEVWKKAEDEE